MKLLRKSKDRRGCVLAATYNAGQWSGLDLPYEKVRETARSWAGFRNQGMTIQKIATLFNHLNLPFRKVRKGTPFATTLAALFEGNSVIFAYHDVQDHFGHAILVTPDFKITNPDYKYKKWSDLFNAICNQRVIYNAWIVGKP